MLLKQLQNNSIKILRLKHPRYKSRNKMIIRDQKQPSTTAGFNNTFKLGLACEKSS